MTVVVTGAGGQLGRALLDAFAAEDRKVIGLTRAELDITDEAAVRATIGAHDPEAVINAAAWTDVDRCEADPTGAYRINASGALHLARACAATGATLVHVSTDYVFGGATPVGDDGLPRPLTEFDPIAPVNVYGRTKAAGEAMVRDTLDTHHIVRTAWLSGPYGPNFITSMLALAREGAPVVMTDDQVGSPTTTGDLAAAIGELLTTDHYGTVHRTNAGQATRYALAAAVFDFAGLPVRLGRQSSHELTGRAPRPAWSVLDDAHATGMGLRPLPPWRDGVRAVLAELGELRH